MKSLYKGLWTALCMCVMISTVSCLSGPETKPPQQVRQVQTKKTNNVSVQQTGGRKEAQENSPRVIFAKQLQQLVDEQKWEDALALFDGLPEKDKNDSSIQNLKIAVLISHGNLQDAEMLAKSLEKQEPNNLEVLYSLTVIAQAKDDKKMRSAYLKKILRIDPNNAQALQEEGIDLYNQRNYKKAGKIFGDIVKRNPNNIEAVIWLGKINYLGNKMKEAEQCYLAALQQQPENSLAIAELARIKSETGRMAEAITDIEKAIALDPGEAMNWTDLGSYNLQIGRREQALEAFQKASTLIPDSHFVHIYLAGLHDDLGNKQEAEQHYRKVTELYPQYYFAYESLGVLLYERQEWEQARTAFMDASQYAPDNCYYALMAAVCSYKLDKKRDAKNFMSKYIKTIDRKKNETDYFLCRLFIDGAGDADVGNRISKEKEETVRSRKYFYLAAFYEAAGKWNMAEKYYIDIKAAQVPAFFEYRLAVSALAAKAK